MGINAEAIKIAAGFGKDIELDVGNGTSMKFHMKPLPGNKLLDFFDLYSRLARDDRPDLSFLTKENSAKVMELVKFAVVNSLSDEDKAGLTDAQIDLFISMNLMKLFEGMMQASRLDVMVGKKDNDDATEEEPTQ